MKAFARLFDELDMTTSTNEKIAALKKYFQKADAQDSMWVLLLLTGRTPKRVLTARDLRNIFLTSTAFPEWLYDESYEHVGDTAETLSLLAHSLELCLQESKGEGESLADWMELEIPGLAQIRDETAQGKKLLSWWRNLTTQEIFILNKLITGAFRVGVSEKLVIRALAEVYNLPSDQIAHRLSGKIGPGEDSFAKIISQEAPEKNYSQPYPFCLAHPWNERSERDFVAADWCVEWKYDGIRAQIIRREGQIWIWSRGEEQINDTFSDVVEMAKFLPDNCVIDGEILVYKNKRILPFQELQKRLGRKKVSPAMISERPAGFFAYDCLEHEGADLRILQLKERKQVLKSVIKKVAHPQMVFSPILEVRDSKDLDELRSQARSHDAEGLMVKLWSGTYTVGRKTGNWWKYKVDPLTLDAVLLYAQAGTGRRSNLYTDYTFALWNEKKELVPFAKAYSGLDQAEIDELDAWIRRHTKEKFGPVRSLEPFYVFEIGFEGMAESTRHKSGIAVRFPRILRWRKDKKVEDADTLQSAKELLQAVLKHE
ncbi:ATP-dependent DNA ligase [Bdellovibrio sp. HCB2-146]|uniref:ATP-dependent DNA ligase n=1 Tax=Bdellovibrio sp. HCB2-146 TaxID=3394362 RepID=UPI0039BC845E